MDISLGNSSLLILNIAQPSLNLTRSKIFHKPPTCLSLSEISGSEKLICES